MRVRSAGKGKVFIRVGQLGEQSFEWSSTRRLHERCRCERAIGGPIK